MMSAAIRVEPGRMEVREFPVPDLQPGEVLVRIERAAVCGSDLHSIYDGLGLLNTASLPGRTGHEAIGTVVESTTDAWAPGTRVLTLGIGSFAEFAAVAADKLVEVPTTVSAERLVIAQQLGVTHYGLERFWPLPVSEDLTVAIIGCGPIGYLFGVQLRRLGFGQIIVSDLSQERLAAAKSAFADEVVHAPGESIVAAVERATGGAGVDLVIEAAGADIARADAITCVRKGGRVGYFGYPERDGGSPFPYHDAFFFRAPLSIEIVANAQSVAGLPNFREAVSLILDDSVDITPLLGVTYPLARMNDALDAARSMRAMKVQVEM